VVVRHQMLAANRRGGEWENVLQFGERSLISTSFYQPFDPAMRWFIEPVARYSRYQQPYWFEGKPVAEFKVEETRAQADLGRVLGTWGELRVGAFYSKNKAETLIGPPAFPAFNDNLAGVGASFRIDTRNTTVFTTQGWDVRAYYQRSLESLGSEADFQLTSLWAEYAATFGRSTLIPHVEFSINAEPLSAFTSVNLGGLGRLSGLGTNELIGQNLTFAKLLYQYRLARIDLAGIRVRLYAGATLEAGNVYEEGTALTWDLMRQGASVYLGAETPIGPVFLGYGQADGGRDRFYLQIGQSY
jgi:NTE family protein